MAHGGAEAELLIPVRSSPARALNADLDHEPSGEYPRSGLQRFRDALQGSGGRCQRGALMAIAALGFAGACAQIALLGRPIGGYDMPLYSGIWSCGLASFWALEALVAAAWASHSDGDDRAQSRWGGRLSAFLMAASMAVLLGLSIGKRPLAAGCAVLLVSALSLRTRLAFKQTRRGKETIASKPGRRCRRYQECCWSSAVALAGLFTCFLAVGCWLQTAGYLRFPPEGQIITITAPGGHTQRIMAYCVGPDADEASGPTVWVEVGGGGHSSSDLWGLQSVLSAPPPGFNRRYCTYDLPGVGWSGDAASPRKVVTDEVMAALGETGPFVCVGSMDGGHDRCYEFALAHPNQTLAVVAAGGVSPFSEFSAKRAFYHTSEADAIEDCRTTNAGRETMAHIYGLFGVCWGLVEALVPAGSFVPAAKSYESHFLNLFNEKQWTTQAASLQRAASTPDCEGFYAAGTFATGKALDPRIGILIYGVTYNTSTLEQQCRDRGLPPKSSDCMFLKWGYESNVNFSKSVVARNPTKNQFITCDACGPDDFSVDQGDNIGWFAETLDAWINSLDSS